MGSRILITDLRALQRGTPPDPSSWIYLGTDLHRRAKVERLLGEKRRLEVGSRLSQAMSVLRQPFQDLIASIGAEQTDTLGWWSSRLSWRMWTTSDLFLLTCYLSVARDLACETRSSGGKLVIVVEDRWLLLQIKEILTAPVPGTSKDLNVPQFQGKTGLTGEKLLMVVTGIARRIWWLCCTLRNWALQRAVWPRAGRVAPERPAAAIFSYPLRSSLSVPGQRPGTEAHGWQDHHLPGLDRTLEENGWQVVRFTPPDCSGFAKAFAARAAYFRPLILFATPKRIWRSLTALWKPLWPAKPTVGELPIGRLLEREWWLDVSRSSFCGFRLFYETLDGLLSHGTWGPVVFSYENQPWEKLAVLAARRHEVHVVGIQTAILSPDYLPYTLGKGEENRMPLPDLILTSGPFAQKVLEEGGFPKERLKMCGAIRYQTLTSVPGTGTVPGTGLRSQILVVLPIHPPVCEDLLEAIRRAFPDGGKKDGIEFTVRPHPLYAAGAARVPFPARALPSSFRDIGQALEQSGLVLFTGSTVGFESIAVGKPALRYRPETTLDVDKEVYADAPPTCGERDLKEALLALVQKGPSAGWEGKARAQVLQLFAPFNITAVREAFKRGKMERFTQASLDDQRESITAGKRPEP